MTDVVDLKVHPTHSPEHRQRDRRVDLQIHQAHDPKHRPTQP